MTAPFDAVLLMGPTASGKSALAMRIASTFDVEIVSVDSAQVYRDMNVGTAKPSAEERLRVPHHLIDILSPLERYSAAAFANDATTLIDDIRARGRLPLLVGGTMLYFKALTHGLDALPQADAAVRAAIDARAASEGWPALHRALAAVDPSTAARLDPSDRQRIQRALEVYEISGQPLSSLHSLRHSSWPARATSPVERRWLPIALVPSDRATLHARIAARFDGMLADGLVDEVRRLRESCPGLEPDLPSMRAVGYRQAWMHIDGIIDARVMRDTGIFATRQLAKRQLTWLRSTPSREFDALDSDMTDQVLTLIESSMQEG